MKNNKQNENRSTKDKRDLMDYEFGEDATKYGEFVPTFHSWMTPDEQRKIVDEKLGGAGKKD